MGVYADDIVRLGRASVGLADQLCADIPADRFARLARGADGPIHANHPAFVIGHLSLYPAMLLEGLGRDAQPAAAPHGYQDIFGAGAECRDDPEGSIYPGRDELLSAFRTTHEALLDSLGTLEDDALAGPNPREGRLREMFPTLGGAMAFILSSHMMMHLGQVSTWRRCEGLGSAM